jgi:plasmid stability protein
MEMATLNIKNLPDPLYRALKARAKREHRSIAQQVTYMLEAALGEPERLSILELQGLGKELWKGMDAAAHVEAERRSWD